MNIAIITCGSNKKTGSCEAREMYEDGIFFKTMRDYVEHHYSSNYFILSSHYGLMMPNQIIEPYPDKMLFVQHFARKKAIAEGRTPPSVIPKKERIEWGKKVASQIDQSLYSQIDWYVGHYYWKYVKEHFTDAKNNKILFEVPWGLNLQKYKI
jgi:hypothetical protein